MFNFKKLAEDDDGEIVVTMIKRDRKKKETDTTDQDTVSQLSTNQMSNAISPTMTTYTTGTLDEDIDRRASIITNGSIEPDKLRELKKLKQAEQKRQDNLKKRQDREQEKRRIEEENWAEEQMKKQIEDELEKKEEKRRYFFY